MKQTITILIFLSLNLCSIPILSQKPVTLKESRVHRSFDALEITSGIVVYLSEGDACNVEIEAEEHILSSVISEVLGSTLKLSVNSRYNNSRLSESNIIVHVTLPKLTSLIVNTKGKVFAKSEFNCDNLDLFITSYGEVTFNEKISVNGKLKVNSSNSGRLILLTYSSAQSAQIVAASKSELTLKIDVANDVDCGAHNHSKIFMIGQADKGLLSASSYAMLKLKDFKLDSANVVATSYALIEVNVKTSLAATATYSGVIDYSGKPKHLSKETTTAGKIK